MQDTTCKIGGVTVSRSYELGVVAWGRDINVYHRTASFGANTNVTVSSANAGIGAAVFYN